MRNRWIGVNYVDLQHRAGQPYPVGLPVVHFGHLGGVYAEITAVSAEFVVPLADGAELDAAAAVTMNGTTAYVLTSLACRIGPGDVVVVQAAAGATGGAVVQLAAATRDGSARVSPAASRSGARPRRTPG